MYIQEDGLLLDALLDKPTKGGKQKKTPLVLILHGFTGYKEEPHIEAVSKALNDIGFATLRADLYGHGKSGGEFRDHTLFKWLTNTLTLVDYARALPWAGDLYLCGHSQGGLTAMLAAAMVRDRIKGLIALSPAAMIPEGARRGELLGMTFDPEHVPETLKTWGGEKTLDGNYVRVAQMIRVEDAIDRYFGPVLLVHGDRDEAVPLQCAIDAAERYRNARLVILPGADHCYTHHLDSFTLAVQEWMYAVSGTPDGE